MVDNRRDRGLVVYQIRVRGTIGRQWSAWFDDLEIVPLETGETLLTGQVTDQAALHGILAKLRDLNLPLVSVTCLSAK
jgi:hypothetical protein